MNEFVIGLSGELDISTTVKTIKEQMPELSSKLNKSGTSERPTLIAALDPTKTIENLQKQLNAISGVLKFSVKNEQLDTIVLSFKEIAEAMQKVGQNADLVNTIHKQTEAYKEQDRVIQGLLKTIKKEDSTTPNKYNITNVERDGLFGTISTTKYYTKDEDDVDNITRKTTVVTQNYEQQTKATAKATNAAEKYRLELTALQKQIKDSSDKKYVPIASDVTAAESRISNILARVDELGKIVDPTQFTQAKTAIDAEIKSLNNLINTSQRAYSQTEKSTNKAFELEDRLQKAQALVGNSDIARPILDETHINTLNDKAVEVTTAINNLKTANADTFGELNRQAAKAVSEFEALVKSYRDAENMANRLRAENVNVIQEKDIQNLATFTARIEAMGRGVTDAEITINNETKTVSQALENLRSMLNVDDITKKSLLEYSDNLGMVQAAIKGVIQDNNLAQSAFEAQEAFERLGGKIDSVSTKIQNSKFGSSPELQGFKDTISNIRESYEAFLQLITVGADNPDVMPQTAEIRFALDSLSSQLKQVDTEFKQFQSTQRGAFKDLALESKKITLSNKITAWLNNNTAAAESVRQTMRDLQKQIEAADGAQLTHLQQQFVALQKQAEATGKVGKSFFDQLKSNIAKFTGWYGIGNAISSIRREISGAITELRDMDTTLTEISKTSNRTQAELEALGKSAFDSASQYGRTVNDYLSGVLEMSRAGYQDAESMAELSVKAQSAGNMTSELANQYLIATDAAYQLNGSQEELSKILDSQNYITNRNAVNMTELAEATKIAASQSASSGVAIDEMTAALGTMIATTQQGGETAARAWRGILMNLQQTAGEIDSTTGEVINAEDLTKYEKAVNALGVSLKTVKDGAIQLRDPIEILKELSVAYNQLSEDDSRRANLLSAIGGKYRANQLDALLKNFDTYEKMLQEFAQGTGSAAEEAEKSANSWQGSLNKFNNAVTELTTNFVTSGNAKSLINFFTSVVKTADRFANSLGGVGTAAGLLAGILTAKSKSLHFNYDADTKSIKFGEIALTGLTQATDRQILKTIALTGATKLANAAISVTASFIIGKVVSAITSWINREEELEQKHQELIRNLEETNNKYKENTDNAEQYLRTYKEILARDEMTETDRAQLLEMQNTILETYGKQAEGIDLVNGKYKEQLGILSQIAQGDYEKQAISATALIDDAIKEANDTANNVLSYSYNKIDDYSKNKLRYRAGEGDYQSTDENGVEEAQRYLDLLKDISGFEYDILKDDIFSDYGIKTFTLGLKSDLSGAEAVDSITEALKKLYQVPRDERTPLFESVEDTLQGLLKDAQSKVDKVNKLFNDNINAIVGRVQTANGINWSNVTDDTFKEWYEAVVSYYDSDQYSEEYRQAILDWFDRNYTSVAQRLARGTTIAEIAYESEQAMRKALNQANDDIVSDFSYSAYAEDISKVTGEVKSLQSIIDKIDKGTYNVGEDAFGLLESHPELLEYINDADLLRKKLIELQQAAPSQLIDDLSTLRDRLSKIGANSQVKQIDALITALKSLGDQAVETVKALTAEDYLKIQTDGIDQIITQINEEKGAEDKVLDSLNDRKSEIQDYYDKQINALKEENEERKKNIDLQEKQKALDDAKRNQVRVYSAARGFTIQQDSEAIAKAQKDLDDAVASNATDELEKQKDREVAAIDEQIKAQKAQIKSKEDEIAEWKNYKEQLKTATEEITQTNENYIAARNQFNLDENSTFADREANMQQHLENIRNLMAEINSVGIETDNAESGGIFGFMPQAAKNAILAMAGLQEANPLAQGNSNNSKLSVLNTAPVTGWPTLIPIENNNPVAPNSPSSKREMTFAPNVTWNITTQKVDDKLLASWWDRMLENEYSKFKSGSK